MLYVYIRVVCVVPGDDTYGRKVIVFSASKLPPREELETGDGNPHAKLLLYVLSGTDSDNLILAGSLVIHTYLPYIHRDMCNVKFGKISCFRYLKHTLDQYVENDYTLVYFHHGMNSKNKPSFRWLRTAYSDFDRK